MAEDYEGPRKKFFRLALTEIKKKYFDSGLKVLLQEQYVPIGIIMGKYDTW